jgi:hypothetical protein
MFAPPQMNLPRPTQDRAGFEAGLREKMARNRQLTQSGQWDNTLAMAMPGLLDGTFFNDPTHGPRGVTNFAQKIAQSPMYSNLAPWMGEWQAAMPTIQQFMNAPAANGTVGYRGDDYNAALNQWANQGIDQLKAWGAQNPNWQQQLATLMGGGGQGGLMAPAMNGPRSGPPGLGVGNDRIFDILRKDKGMKGGRMGEQFFAPNTPWGQGLSPPPQRPTNYTFGDGQINTWRQQYDNWLAAANQQFAAYPQANPNWQQEVQAWANSQNRQPGPQRRGLMGGAMGA